MNIKTKHILIGIVLLHFLIFDYLILSTYWRISTLYTENKAFTDIFASIDFAQNAFGLSSLFEDRLPPSYLGAIHQLYALLITNAHRLMVVDGHVVVDTSTNMETSIILGRISTRHLSVKHMVVDVGAMDGVSGSNSFNFVAIGWDAILVEPYHPHVRSIERNLDLYLNRVYQNISVVEGVVSETDGTRTMSIFPHNSKTSNTILSERHPDKETIIVKSYTPRTLGDRYNIPSDFGVLTVDAEGVDSMIVREFMRAGFRPSFVVLETRLLGAGESDGFLREYGYHLIAKVGSNAIWEHV